MGTFQGVAGHVRGSPFTATFEDGVSKERNKMEGPVMMDKLRADLRELQQFTKATSIGLQAKVDKDDIKMLLNVKQHLFNVTSRKSDIDLAVDSTGVTLDYLAGLGADMKRLQTQLQQYSQLWQDVQKQAPTTKVAIAPLVKVQGAKTKVMLQKYEEEVREYSESFNKQGFYTFATGPDAAREALKAAEKNHIEKWSTRTHDNEHLAQMFEFPEAMDETNKLMSGVSEQINAMRDLWDVATQVLDFIDECRNMAWADVDAEALDEEAKRLQKQVKGLKREVRFSNAYKETEKTIKDFLTTCPLILALRHPSMRPRHWQMLMDHTGKKFTPPHEDPSMKLAEVLALRLHEYGSDVEDITDQAQKEAKMEDTLAKLTKYRYIVRVPLQVVQSV